MFSNAYYSRLSNRSSFKESVAALSAVGTSMWGEHGFDLTNNLNVNDASDPKWPFQVL
jgi:hypothetical protein